MYLAHATGIEEPKAQVFGTPRPGHGIVFIVPLADGTWWASWQDDFPPSDAGPRAGLADFKGPKDDAVAWARAQPAERHLIFSAEANDYVPMDT